MNVEVLIINIPPSLRKNPAGFHLKQVAFLCEILPDWPKNVIFISSTSVYPKVANTVNEESDVDQSHELVKAENLIRERWKEKSTILRCGGLMGYERVPGKYFAGKKDIPGGNNPVNYVHRDDVVKIIYKIVEEGVFGETFNVVAPVHPLKKEVCVKTAKYFNLQKPEFLEGDPPQNRIVDGEKLVQKLNYIFDFPDPVDFFYELP